MHSEGGGGAAEKQDREALAHLMALGLGAHLAQLLLLGLQPLGGPVVPSRLLGHLVLLPGLGGGQRLVILPLQVPHVWEDQPAEERHVHQEAGPQAPLVPPPASHPSGGSAAAGPPLPACRPGLP